MSTAEFNPARLDVRRFAQLSASLAGHVPLSKLERLAQDLWSPDAESASKTPVETVSWTANGETLAVTGGAAQTWIHLEIHASLPMQCQRCLQAMEHEMKIQRSFRFVRDETEAEAQDDDAEEDLLVASKQFNLLELIEDELIMALPFAPTHEVCPKPVKLESSSQDFAAALEQKPHAFAALGELKAAMKGSKTKGRA